MGPRRGPTGRGSCAGPDAPRFACSAGRARRGRARGIAAGLGTALAIGPIAAWLAGPAALPTALVESAGRSDARAEGGSAEAQSGLAGSASGRADSAGPATWLSRAGPAEAAPAPDRGGGAPEPSPHPPAAGLPAASRGPLPGSLQGTEPDGGLSLDASGHFLPDRDARRLFDYFLSASGEEPEAVLRGRIVLHLRAHLPPAAAAEAEAVLDRYLRLRSATRELVRSDAAPADLERRLQWLRELRRRELGPELAGAFYGEQERRVAVDLARRRVAGSPDLDARERAARLEALEERLPEEVRRARRRASAPLAGHREVASLRRAGAPEGEIFDARAERFGEEAARRLAALDRRRAAWRSRLDAYRDARDALLAGERPAAERAEALAALRERRFEGPEVRRVRALDRLEGVAP